MATIAEELTYNFYNWEYRGRGLYLYDNPVCLEPPFVPFSHTVTQAVYKDDGLKPSIFESVFNLLKSKPEVEDQNSIDIEPFLFEENFSLKAFCITIPETSKVTATETEQLLLMLSLASNPLCFEIIGNAENIQFQIVCREPDYEFVRAQIKGFFPECYCIDSTDIVDNILLEDVYSCVADLSLSQEFMRPIKMPSSLDPDSFIGITSLFDTLKTDEQGIIQIQFSGTVNSWADSIIRSVGGSDGKSFFRNAPEMTVLAKQKVSAPLLAVSIKLLGQSRDQYRAINITQSLCQVMTMNSQSECNKLVMIEQSDYTFELRLEDFVKRQSHKLGMLLNIREILLFVHFPTSSVKSLKINRGFKRTKRVPPIFENNEFVLGVNTHQQENRSVSVTSSQRLKHTHIIGATGTGKSTFITTLIIQDIDKGSGLAVIDPHGDLIESILKRIPPERYDDVILVDPSDTEFPIGFNILSAHSDIEREILASDLVSVFRRLSTSWGDQMNSVFANAILAFLESKQGGTLIDLRRFLIEKDYRNNFLKTIDDPSILYYWQKEYPLLKSTSVGPILTRLDAFLRPKVIRNMVAQNKSLDFENILDSGKILLVKLSQGLVGVENSYLLGSFFITKFYQAAMARQIKSNEARKDFFVYIDEFQNFITPSMSAILSGARKYHLGLILAHQDMQQLIKQDAELASSIISNAGIRACFRLGDIDAKKFEDGFSFFEAKDLQNLSLGQLICRIERNENDFNMESLPFPLLFNENLLKLKEVSRAKYGNARIEVEENIRNSLNFMQSKSTTVIVEKVDNTSPNEFIETKSTFQRIDSINQKLNAEETKSQLLQKQVETAHRYLQNLIKKMAQLRGYKANIEEPLSDRSGMVDVSLERNGKRIACEISNTTKPSWEIHNIEKCFSNGFHLVVVCSSDHKVLDKIKSLATEELDNNVFGQVLFMNPDQLFQYMDEEIALEASTEVRTKGYRVQVKYNPVSEDEMKRKKDAVSKTIFGPPKKKKE